MRPTNIPSATRKNNPTCCLLFRRPVRDCMFLGSSYAVKSIPVEPKLVLWDNQKIAVTQLSVIVNVLNTIPVLPVVAVVLEFIVASSPGCNEVVPDSQVQCVELVMPKEDLGRYCASKRQRDHHHCRQRPCHIYQSRENTATDSEAPLVIQ